MQKRQDSGETRNEYSREAEIDAVQLLNSGGGNGIEENPGGGDDGSYRRTY